MASYTKCQKCGKEVGDLLTLCGRCEAGERLEGIESEENKSPQGSPEGINDILVELTDKLGWRETLSNLRAFHKAEEDLIELIKGRKRLQGGPGGGDKGGVLWVDTGSGGGKGHGPYQNMPEACNHEWRFLEKSHSTAWVFYCIHCLKFRANKNAQSDK